MEGGGEGKTEWEYQWEMLMVGRFQEKFKWTPTEGQLRSQFWYFKRSSVSAGGRNPCRVIVLEGNQTWNEGADLSLLQRRMREFLTTYHRVAKRDGGGKETAAQIMTRLRMGSLRPSW